MKNKIILSLFIFFLENNKPTNFSEEFIEKLPRYTMYSFMASSLFVLIGTNVSHLYYHVLNMDPEGTLKTMEERLRDEQYWKNVYGDNIEKITKGKNLVQSDIDKFKKIILEKEERKKKEAEQKKKEEEEKQMPHPQTCPGGLSHFFFVKNLQRDPNYNQWVCQRMVKSMQQRVSTRHPLSRYSYPSLLFNTLQTVSTRYHNLKQIKKDYVQKLSSSTITNTLNYPLWSL